MPVLGPTTRRHLLWTMSLALLILPTVLGAVCPKRGLRPGSWAWSKQAIELCFQDENTQERELVVPSPGRRKTLLIKGDKLSLKSGKKEFDLGSAAGAEEALWSVDSTGLILTSGLGSAGPNSVSITLERDGTLTDVPVMDTIRADFKARYSMKKRACAESVNVGGLTWLQRSSKAVLVAEIPPSPGCGEDAGYFESYVVSVPDGKIVARYTMEETAKRWGSFLGKRLRDDLWTVRQNRKDHEGQPNGSSSK